MPCTPHNTHAPAGLAHSYNMYRAPPAAALPGVAGFPLCGEPASLPPRRLPGLTFLHRTDPTPHRLTHFKPFPAPVDQSLPVDQCRPAITAPRRSHELTAPF